MNIRRRYYIAPLDVVLEHRDVFHNLAGTHYLCLYHPAKPGAKEEWEAAGRHVLLNATFRMEAHADRWHAHEAVAILPDYSEEGTQPLKSHLARPTRKLKQKHIDHLSAIGVAGDHTVLDVEQKAHALMPSMKLRSVL